MNTSQAGFDLDAPGLTGRIGGSLGRHVRIAGVWFDPVPWVFGVGLVAWVLGMAHQTACMTNNPAHFPNAFSGLCYSDISTLYQARDNFWSGAPLYAGDKPLEYPPLAGGLIWLSRWLTGRFGGVIAPDVDGAGKLAAANIFFSINAFLLFCCFLALLWAHLQMGRTSATRATDGVAVRSWDALLIAASPLVMAAAFINWDLLAVALTSLALLAWARQHPLLAGVFIGLACSAKFYPLALVAVLLVLCVRASKLQAFIAMAFGAVLSWAVLNVPMALTNYTGWSHFFTYNEGRGRDLGSVWYVLDLMGLPVGDVNLIEIVLLAVLGAIIILLVLLAPRRPRVGQVALLVMVAFLVVNKVYSPQYMLWLLPLVVLARPVILDVAVFTIAELGYFIAVWGLLGGALALGSGADRLYWLAVGLRVGVQLWIAMRVVDDILRPWQDPVRRPLVDDPIGGVLDHAPDAAFMLRRIPPPATLYTGAPAGGVPAPPAAPAAMAPALADTAAPPQVPPVPADAPVDDAVPPPPAAGGDVPPPPPPPPADMAAREAEETAPAAAEDAPAAIETWEDFESVVASIDKVLHGPTSPKGDDKPPVVARRPARRRQAAPPAEPTP